MGHRALRGSETAPCDTVMARVWRAPLSDIRTTRARLTSPVDRGRQRGTRGSRAPVTNAPRRSAVVGDPEISPDFLLGFSVSLKLLRETKPIRGRRSATRARRRRSVPRGPPTPRSSRGACGRPPRSPVTHVAASSSGGSARPAPAGPPAPPSTCAARPLTGTGWARGSRVPGRDGTIRGASGHLRPLLPAPCCSHCGTRDQAAAAAGRCLAVTGGYPDAS